LHDISVDLFRSIIFEHSRLNPRIVDGACDLIAVDRAGEDLDREIFSKAISMFHDMVVYTKYFEPRMLELSQKYVLEWADTTSAEKSLSGYVKAAQALMKNEIERVEKFGLNGSTKRDLLTLLEDHLISRKESRLSKLRHPYWDTNNFTDLPMKLTRTNSPISWRMTSLG